MNLKKEFVDLWERMWSRHWFRATVTGVDGELITVQRPNRSSPDGQKYASNKDVTFVVDDEVIVVRQGGGWFVLVRIGRAGA